MSGNEQSGMLVHGSLMVGYAQACKNLNIVAGRAAHTFIDKLEINNWYPLEQWQELEHLVLRSYSRVEPILVRVGVEMMTGWYHFGPGRNLIKNGAAFLHFQTGSQGFTSVVQGSPEQIGTFDMDFYDRRRGRAVIHSTTPFNRWMERGVLIGGMSAPGDLDYVDVLVGDDPDLLHCEFH